MDRPDRYSYRELRHFADAIRDRLKQYPTVGKIDEIGTQNEAIYLYYSSRRFNGLDLSPQTIAARLERRNINLPGGRMETPLQSIVLQPSGEFKSEQELGEVPIDVQGDHPTYLRDLVDIVRGYEDPPGVMNFRSVKVDAQDPPERKLPGELAAGLLGDGDVNRPLPGSSRAANHACRHAGRAADQGHADRCLRPRRASGAGFAQGRAARRSANRADAQRTGGGRREKSGSSTRTCSRR